MKEEYLLTGALEETNDAYAVAKIAGIKMCEAYNRQYHTSFLSVMPTNLYGPGDNFDLEDSHVLPALIRKFHEAKTSSASEVVVWGTGTPRREFLHVDDMADCSIFLTDLPDEQFNNMVRTMRPTIINIGTGIDITIAEVANIVKKIVGFSGKLVFDTDKPDGPPRKLLDVSRANDLGWQARITLDEGIAGTYQWFLNSPDLRK